MGNSKPIIDQSKSKNSDRNQKDKNAGVRQGIANQILQEPIPYYDIADCEIKTEGRNNTFIIMGRDRPHIKNSGYGGRGATQAGRIDLIAGMSSAFRHKDGSYGPPNDETMTSPNFAIDAARIYISQKSDIDRHMGLAEVPGQAVDGRSTIGLKADTIRIHSRRDIKIVTGRGRFEKLGKDGERLSNGGKNETVGTISLIAGNNTEDKRAVDFDFLNPLKIGRSTVKGLQPIPKGNNLEECLLDIMSAIQELSAMVGDNTSLIQKMDLNLVSHVHPLTPPIAGPGSYVTITPMIQANSVKTFAGRKLFNKKVEMLKSNYLDVLGSRYINSNFVYTT
tara:strand:- start:1638 stop:2645 length:1008 start_codon:yes stop_codon:yes gene_type:complete